MSDDRKRALDRLRLAAKARRRTSAKLDERIAEQAQRARSAGATWSECEDATGMTRQGLDKLIARVAGPAELRDARYGATD